MQNIINDWNKQIKNIFLVIWNLFERNELNNSWSKTVKSIEKVRNKMK